jgi:hypothetical protein
MEQMPDQRQASYLLLPLPLPLPWLPASGND